VGLAAGVKSIALTKDCISGSSKAIMAIPSEVEGLADGATLEQQTTSDSSEKAPKEVQIQQACEQQDLQLLIQLADSSGGLLEDRFRQLACKTLSDNPRLWCQSRF
jgi:hypothetical protein